MNSQSGRTHKDLEQDLKMFEEMLRLESKQNNEKYRTLLAELCQRDEC